MKPRRPPKYLGTVSACWGRFCEQGKRHERPLVYFPSEPASRAQFSMLWFLCRSSSRLQPRLREQGRHCEWPHAFSPSGLPPGHISLFVVLRRRSPALLLLYFSAQTCVPHGCCPSGISFASLPPFPFAPCSRTFLPQCAPFRSCTWGGGALALSWGSLSSSLSVVDRP